MAHIPYSKILKGTRRAFGGGEEEKSSGVSPGERGIGRSFTSSGSEPPTSYISLSLSLTLSILLSFFLHMSLHQKITWIINMCSFHINIAQNALSTR